MFKSRIYSIAIQLLLFTKHARQVQAYDDDTVFAPAHNMTVHSQESCTLVIQNMLGIENDFETDELIACIVDPIHANGVHNVMLPLNLSPSQSEDLSARFKSGELVSAVSILKLEKGNFQINPHDVSFPSDYESFCFTTDETNGVSDFWFGKRPVEGDKNVLVVKVIDSQDLAIPDSTDAISDNIFGTFGDSLNLRSQMKACSFDTIDMIPAEVNGHTDSPGVIEVSIDISLKENNRSTIQNAVTTALQQLLGQALPANYDHVMYLLEGCYDGCGWAAYANTNSFLSVYQGNYYKYAAVQSHGEFFQRSFRTFDMNITSVILF